MPITMVERFSSRSRRINRMGEAELRFLVNGSEDDQAVTDHVLANAPATWADMPSQETSIEPLGGGAWDVIVRYAPSTQQNQAEPIPPPEIGDSEFSFDTTGGTQHVTQAKETVAAYPHPDIGVCSDWQGAIGVTENGVEGVDIVVPQMAYEETHQIAAYDVEAWLVGVIFGLTGKVNDAPFKGFAAGELLFLGAQGRKRKSEGFWTVTFRFAGSRNATGLAVGAITGIDKEGWHYLDVQYETVDDADAGMLARKPVAARVHRVYDTGDFSSLGI
jgi:hypothetical protein